MLKDSQNKAVQAKVWEEVLEALEKQAGYTLPKEFC